MIPPLWLVDKSADGAMLTFGDGIVFGLLLVAAFVGSVGIIQIKREIISQVKKRVNARKTSLGET